MIPAFQPGFQPGFQGVDVANAVSAADGVAVMPPGPPLAELLARQAAELVSQDAARDAAIGRITALMTAPERQRAARRRADALWALDLIDDDEWMVRRKAA